MSESLEVSTVLPAAPEQIYRAWLSSQAHSDFTGSPAEIDPRLGGQISAWDGYIQGTILALEPFRRILQAWRTSDFPEGAPDSMLELRLEAVEGGTQLTLIQMEIPDGQGEDYRQGWTEYYFQPMLDYFS
jgi:activator of HSP90 ATPase